jgi:hypothetical protein
MNLDAARIAEELANNSVAAADTAAAVEIAEKNAQCTVQYALPVEQKQLFLSNQLAKDQFIAEIASKPGEATTDKFLLITGISFMLVPFYLAK